MLPMFFGLMTANLLMLALVFVLGLGATDAQGALTGLYRYHIALAIASGLLSVLAHVATYMYFMATTKWLHAAADKANLDLPTFVAPARKRKSRCFAVAMSAIGMTMLTMFAGAGADPTVNPWWPSEVHLGIAAAMIGVQLICALHEYRLIGEQSALMDRALAAVNENPSVTIQTA